MRYKAFLTVALCALGAAWAAPAEDTTMTTANETPAPALRPGGSNREAFSVDRTTTLAEVLREVDGLVRRTGHKYTWDDYLALLDELQKSERYVVCPGREFLATTAPDKVVVYMRHDIDVDPATALRMAGFETGARVSLLTHPIHWGEPLTAPGAVPAEAPPAAAAGAAAGH
ncbi:MAG: hypothetical protein GX595_09720 [Lentisphaerae bacterium]|nr:hypothetical protein [Lentisphaerota bacterium]